MSSRNQKASAIAACGVGDAAPIRWAAYCSERHHFVTFRDMPTLLDLEKIDKLADYNAWLVECGRAPVSAAMHKTLLKELDALRPELSFKDAVVADRPGRFGDSYVEGDHNIIAPDGVTSPKIGFRQRPGIGSKGPPAVSFKAAAAMSSNAASFVVAALMLDPVFASVMPLSRNSGVWLWGQAHSGHEDLLRWGASFHGDPARLVQPIEAAQQDLSAAIAAGAGGALLLDGTRADVVTRGSRKGHEALAAVLSALQSGTSSTGFGDDQHPAALSYCISSYYHPSEMLGARYRMNEALLSSMLVLPMDNMPLSQKLKQKTAAATQKAYGLEFSACASGVMQAFKSDPALFADRLKRHENSFKDRVDGDLGTHADAAVVDMLARFHGILNFAVAKRYLPEAYKRPDELLRCLSEHRRGASSLTALEQLLSWVSLPEVIALGTSNLPNMSDDELHRSIFKRQIGGKTQLCLSRRKLDELVRTPTIFLLDETIRRCLRPGSDRDTLQVAVRRDRREDHLLCFNLPYPV